MGILDRLKRVSLRDGEWIDVRPLSVEEARLLDSKARKLKATGGESEEAARSYFYMEVARERAVAWSDPAEPTPENVARIGSDVNQLLWDAITGGEAEEVPLPIGSPSTATSTE